MEKERGRGGGGKYVKGGRGEGMGGEEDHRHQQNLVIVATVRVWGKSIEIVKGVKR